MLVKRFTPIDINIHLIEFSIEKMNAMYMKR